MKPVSLFFVALLLCVKCFGQQQSGAKDNPFFAQLAEIKSASETDLKAVFTEQQLIANTIADVDPTDKSKEKLILKNFEDDKHCLKAYNKLKLATDMLINQLKADLTISNKKKNLTNLNNGVVSGWYKDQLTIVKNSYTDFTSCRGGENFYAVSVSDVTGIFSALVTVVTSARDFRAQMITTMCAQLDSLKLTDAYDLLNGNTSGGGTPSAAAAATTNGAAIAKPLGHPPH